MRWICMVMHQTRWHILNRPIREVIVSDSQGNLKIIVFIIRLVFVGDTTEILRGRGSERGKFLRWKRCTKSFLSRGFKLQSNKHYCIFPINFHNQTNRNVPFIKINVRFFACTFHYTDILYTPLTQTLTPLSSTFFGCQIKETMYNKADKNVDISYYKDRAVFNLNEWMKERLYLSVNII